MRGDAGDWEGGVKLALPRGSVLRVDGAAAGPQVMHAVCRCTAPRYSLVFRRLSEASRQEMEAMRAAAENSAAMRRERRLAAKIVKGWRPKPQGTTAGEQASRSAEGTLSSIELVEGRSRRDEATVSLECHAPAKEIEIQTGSPELTGLGCAGRLAPVAASRE